MTWAQPPVDVVGVILNKAGSARHASEVVRSIGDRVPVLGILQRDDGIEAPSRHLGLVPAAERGDAAAALDRLAAQIAEKVDLEAVVRLAAAAPDLAERPWDPHSSVVEVRGAPATSLETSDPSGFEARSARTSTTETASARTSTTENTSVVEVRGAPATSLETSDPSGFEARSARTSTSGGGARIAVAGGRAFTFRYAETVELLEAAGAEVVDLDPLTDSELPEGTTGLYLGGGFPEMHAMELTANEQLRADIKGAVGRGLPTVAECAGLLYLCRTVAGPSGQPAHMVGAIPADAAMAPRLTLSYRRATSPTDNLLSRRGEEVTGHEFHRTHLLGDTGGQPAWWLDAEGGPHPAGVGTRTLHASYLHVHWAGHPHLATRFVEAARRAIPVTAALR